jgi:tetratricopeptide (TPR) repeat protein
MKHARLLLGLGLAAALRAGATEDHAAAAPAPAATPATPATPAAEPAPATAHAHAPGPEAAEPEQEPAAVVDSLLRIGETKLAARDTEAAIVAFRQAAKMGSGDAAAQALQGLARALRLQGDAVKAIATYERLVQNHGEWRGLPLALLELGRTLRETGAPRLAMSRFYSVIHGTLKLPEAEETHYRQLVRTAQFEIAETHLALGDAAEAVRFFRRLDLLDLEPEDRARARFRTAQAQLLGGDKDGARVTLELFVEQDAKAKDAGEARFLLAQLHAEAGRGELALRVTLDLLRIGQETSDAQAWRGWQQRTGTFLAGKFFAEGDFYSALLLWRAMAELDATPGWRAPALYQVGLCLERLQQPEQALKTYEELAALLGTEPEPAQRELARMAKWRAGQLEWTRKVREEIRDLSSEPQAATLPVIASTTPATAP